jgi:hypothetical protein
MKPVHVACAAGVEKLYVVVQIEAIEVDTLASLNLLDTQNHASP